MEAAVGARWIDAREAAEMLGMHRATVYELARTGSLRSMQIKTGGGHSRYRFRPEWIEAFIREHTTGGKSS